MARFTYIPNRVIDTNGIADGAAIYVLQSGTMTPVPIYTDAEMTVETFNPFVVAAGARVPELFYAGAPSDIRVRIVASDGEVISDDDPYSPPLLESDLEKVLVFQPDGSGALPSTYEATLKAGDVLPVEHFGAKFDGVTDDTAALQAAIDEAARSGRKLLLPKGSARVTASLDLRNKDIVIEGPGFTQCTLFTAQDITLLNMVEVADRQFLPIRLSGFSLIGGGGIGRGYALAGRHRPVFENMRIAGFHTSGREKDAWLSRRFNVSYDTSNRGLHLVGSNHSSAWRSCNFIGCSEAHVLIESNGTAEDGNDAVVFSNCDVEFSQPNRGAHGVVARGSVRAAFNDCYTGEVIYGHSWTIGGSAVIDVNGGLHLYGKDGAVANGGFLCWLEDGTGQITFRNGARIASHGPSIAALAAGPNSATYPKGMCKALFEDANIFAPTGGDLAMGGDCLGYLPSGGARPFLPTQPRSYSNGTNAPVAATLSTPSGHPNARRLTCTTGGSGNMTFTGDFLHGDFETDRPMYFVMVYRSTKQVRVQIDGYLFALPPATGTIATAVKVDANLPGGSIPTNLFIYIQNPAAGDELEIHGVYVADARLHLRGEGNLFRLGKF